MFCRKCGKEIPDDSEFCPKCGARCSSNGEIEIDIDDSGKVNLEKPKQNSNAKTNAYTQKNNAPAVSEPVLKCPECNRQILPSWTRCSFCGAFNPYNTDIKPTVNQNIITPPPQVIIKEERVVIKEPQKEEKGCGELIGEIIGGLIVFGIMFGWLGSCFGCTG